MALGYKKKEKINIKVILPIIFLTIMIGVCVIAYFLRDRESLSNYTVLYGSSSDESVDYLRKECKQRTDSILVKYNGITSRLLDNVVILTNDIMTIPDMGRSEQCNDEGMFLIYHWENNLYIYAADDEVMKVAINYFVNKCLDKDGKILAEEGKVINSSGNSRYDELYIGDAPIEVFSISYEKKSLKNSAELLQYYVAQCSGTVIDIKKENAESEILIDGVGRNADIHLGLDDSLEAGHYSITKQGDDIVITASDNKTMNNAVCMFANRYLGWYYAGTGKEHFNSQVKSIHIEIFSNSSGAWVEEREPIITLWNENYPRGFYISTDVSLEADVMSFSDDQLYDYVRMMQYCGYTGIQVTDMCSAWAGAGGYETVQNKIRVMFDAAHCLGMNTTLWVWGAEFDGYGWNDSNVTVTRYSVNVREDEAMYAVFNDYYNKYAELADCTDRLIAHFYDPGQLSDTEDIAFYSKLLWSKFSAVNPKIDFGINCWGDKFDKAILVRELGNEFTIYEGTVRNEESSYQDFRSFVAEHNNKLGTWSWNNCEMEIDQLAQMNYNAEIIKSTYLTAREYDSVCKSEYWSEMDSNHLVNLFSLYCAAQLLQNPDMDTYELTEKIATDAVGPEYSAEITDMLMLVQKARSGESWDTYFWSSEDYILLSDDYPATEILQESEKALADLDKMVDVGIESYAIPLPISMVDLLSLIRPQIQQIHDYAEFRIALDDLEAICRENAELLTTDLSEETGDTEENTGSAVNMDLLNDTEEADGEMSEQAEFIAEITDKISEIGEPIKEYNCVIGSWGQIEARAQQIMVAEFCENYGIEKPHYSTYDLMWKNRIISQFASYQRGEKEPLHFGAPYYQYGYALGTDETERLVTAMVEDGILIRNDDGSVSLVDWDNYIYMTRY